MIKHMINRIEYVLANEEVSDHSRIILHDVVNRLNRMQRKQSIKEFIFGNIFTVDFLCRSVVMTACLGMGYMGYLSYYVGMAYGNIPHYVVIWPTWVICIELFIWSITPVRWFK